MLVLRRLRCPFGSANGRRSRHAVDCSAAFPIFRRRPRVAGAELVDVRNQQLAAPPCDVTVVQQSLECAVDTLAAGASTTFIRGYPVAEGYICPGRGRLPLRPQGQTTPMTSGLATRPGSRPDLPLIESGPRSTTDSRNFNPSRFLIGPMPQWGQGRDSDEDGVRRGRSGRRRRDGAVIKTSDALTRREREVASLVAEGLTNRQIAERLFISERTAESHIEHLRNKLAVRSRSQIATWWTAAGSRAQSIPSSHAMRAGGPAPRLLVRWVPGALLVVVALVLAAVAVGPLLRPGTAPTAITTIAGNGVRGWSGDAGPAATAALTRPSGIAIGPDGTVYVIDGERIRSINNGRIDTTAGTGDAGYSGDGGSARLAEISMQLAYGDFPYASAQGIAVDAVGIVYIADNLNNRIRRVTKDGLITTVAGSGLAGFTGDGGQATQAQISHPQGVAVDSLGAVYIADTGNNRIRKVDSAGVISTIAGPDGLDHPEGLALDPTGNLYVADTEHHRVVEIIRGGLRVIAGTGKPGYSGDGAEAASAQLNLPVAVAVSPAGLLYIADSGNNRIRRVDAEGRIDSVAGTGQPGYSGDGGPARKARLDLPIGVAVGPDGSVYVADNLNNRIRRFPG